MIKKVIMIMFVLTIASSASADSFFEEENLSDLRVLSVDQQDGLALIQDHSGNEWEVSVGDLIGWERAVIVAVDKVSITVEQENLQTIIPVVAPLSGN
jgi:hypothetical protein